MGSDGEAVELRCDERDGGGEHDRDKISPPSR